MSLKAGGVALNLTVASHFHRKRRYSESETCFSGFFICLLQSLSMENSRRQSLLPSFSTPQHLLFLL
ncbi:hypothetical protein RDI58_018415 [Solanum bulbocastanum]|uniref:Uncharacterized protein n=1 Tax=Solanum bulbocastanum TaxID=147425 RepID=A0AAN8Y9Q2_SOLBU